MSFDIPEQPLDSALEDFMRATGLQGFYQSAATTSLISNAVKGRFTPQKALAALLAGTNLTARYPVDGAFTIAAVPRGQASVLQARPPGRRIVDYDSFLGTVQDRIIASLCRNVATRPGNYRAALQFSIESSGTLESPSLLGTTGDVPRDRAIAGMLRRLAIGETPPPAMPQPVTMLILPRRPGFPDDCRDRLPPGSVDEERN